MEEMQDQGAPKMSSVENDHEEFEMSHTDKIVGVFSEPVNTFSKTAKFPPKTTDWILPLVVVMVVALLAQIVMMTNPSIRLAATEKGIKQVEKQFDSMVAKGQMTQAQANEQLDKIRDQMNQGFGISKIIFSAIGIVVVTFIVFFIVTGVFMLFAKLIFKGDGTYKDAMVAYGLPHYISVIQIIVMVMVAFVMNKALSSVSVAAFMDIDTSTIGGFLLNKLDIFSIWFYVIVGVGFAKMFKSNDIGKYILLILCIWIGFSLIFFFIAKSVPFLSGFIGA
jgi:hypothetical protein